MESMIRPLIWEKGNDKTVSPTYYGTIQKEDGLFAVLFSLRPLIGERRGYQVVSELHRIFKMQTPDNPIHETVEEAKFAAEKQYDEILSTILIGYEPRSLTPPTKESPVKEIKVPKQKKVESESGEGFFQS